MSAESPQNGIAEQDRTLSDLLESYRHRQTDPAIPDERKRRAAERMKPVWAKLAKLQDPDGFVTHVSEHIQREYQRRHNYEDMPEVEHRNKPLCRCDLSKHVCEAKQGEVPSKIRTQDLTYISKPDSRTLARQYVQEHAGDVIVREAMEEYRNLRSDIYAAVSDILAMMMGAKDLTDESEGADASEGDGDGTDGPSPGDDEGGAHVGTASPHGGESEGAVEPAPDGGEDDAPDGVDAVLEMDTSDLDTESDQDE